MDSDLWEKEIKLPFYCELPYKNYKNILDDVV